MASRGAPSPRRTYDGDHRCLERAAPVPYRGATERTAHGQHERSDQCQAQTSSGDSGGAVGGDGRSAAQPEGDRPRCRSEERREVVGDVR